jgi:hypothetical protein
MLKREVPEFVETHEDRGQRPIGLLADRARAAGVHLVVSGVVAALILALVYLGWYPAPLSRVMGVGEILVLVVAVDVVLGPALTFIVFDRRKRGLRFDLATIATLQLVALIGGTYAVEAGRPHHLVFVKDRFEAVSRPDLAEADRGGNPAATVSFFGPTFVAAEAPADPKERERILFEALVGGRDLQHYPALYRPLDTQRDALVARAAPLDQLRALNPDRAALLDASIASIGKDASDIGYLPIKGPKQDAAVLVDRVTGMPLLMVDLRPWR